MSDKVIVTREKLDSLAEVVASKSGVPVPLTFDGMEDAVLSIIIPTGTKSITENGTGIDVARYASVDVAVPSPDNFVVNLSYNESTEMWEPDKTYAEMHAAHQAGKTVVLYTPDAVAAGGFDGSIGTFYYSVLKPCNGSSGINGYYINAFDSYEQGINDNGVFLDNTCRYYDVTLHSNATPSDVTQGKLFYNASGLQAGTRSATVVLQDRTVAPSNVNITVTAQSGYDGLGTVTVEAIPSEYIIPTGTKSITANGTGIDVAQYASVDVAVPTPALQSKSVTPTEQQQTVSPDSGYDGLSSVTVGAIPSEYVGSGVTQRSSTDLTASGATVTVPAGYYSAQASKAVASGTAGTPTATKGTVSNHSVSVTPSVTNTAGYIAGGTKSGTAVTVQASELVSGSQTLTDNGTVDVTNLASVTVDIDFVTYHTSTSAPTSSQGSDGDIWLVTA